MLDWSRLKTYQNSKYKSFEELCYQLAKRLHGTGARFTSIDDSGGGDGVEFYLTLPNGDQWGWQAKFYWPSPRLDASRKRSIIDSLKTSRANHPRLVKWFLCTPTSFTSKGKNNETTWFSNTLGKIAGPVQIEHWDDRTIHEYVVRPEMAGISRYFFGDLELFPEWFEHQVQRQIANIKDKYLPDVHVVSSAENRIHSLLGNTTALNALKHHFTRATEGLQTAIAKLQNLPTTATREPLGGDRNQTLAIAAATFDQIVRAALRTLKQIDPSNKASLSSTQFSDIYQSLADEGSRYETSVSSIRQRADEEASNSSHTAESEAANSRIHAFFREFYEPFEHLESAQASIRTIKNQLEDFESGALHQFGIAGLGKTQLCAHLADTLTRAAQPALLFLGRSFSRNQTIEKRMLQELDIPATYSWTDFLAALNAYAESRNCRVLFLIDGLNESQDPRIWHDELAGFAATLKRFEGIALVTTCRPSYREQVFADPDSLRSIWLRQFQAEALETLTDQYFSHYKLKADTTFASLEQFSNPLYLRLFCEVQNPERQVEKEVYVGEQDMFSVLDAYLDVANHEIASKANKPSAGKILHKIIDDLAERLWDDNTRRFSFSKTVEMFDERTLVSVEWNQSVTKAALDVELVIARDVFGGEEGVSFTFDLLGGFAIANYLLKNKDASAVRSFLEADDTKKRLVGREYSERHPLHEDILRALCALVPARTGLHLYKLSEEGYFPSAVESLFEMNPRYITTEEVALVKRLFSIPNNRQILFPLFVNTAFNRHHPLNMAFQTELLKRMSLVDRDLSWTEYLRTRPTFANGHIERLIRACRTSRRLSQIEQERLLLGGLYTMWLLTSTRRLLRDRATKALTTWGQRFPRTFFDVVLNSLPIDDPYIRERTIAAAYGVAMRLYGNQKRQKFRNVVLPVFARKLYEALFAPTAPQSTTHALTRDYARHLLELALLQTPGLLTAAELARIRPPFKEGGIRHWRRSKDRNEHEYRDGNSPLGMDFANYTLGRLVPGRKNYDFEDPNYRRVKERILWRIYQLGYSLQRFGEIDKQVARSNWDPNRNETNDRRIDRYGKKYAWIAYYELYGIFRDEGKLKSRWHTDEEVRPSDIDIDPSFPGKPATVRIWNDDPFVGYPADWQDWINDNTCPSLEALFRVPFVAGHDGSWDLLNSWILATDPEGGKEFFAHINMILIPTAQVDRFKHLAKTQPTRLSSNWSVPGSHYVFAGEVPWADVFFSDGSSNLSFTVGKKMRRVPSITPIWPHKQGANGLFTLRFKKSFQMQERDVVQSIPAFIPVHEVTWEDYHSGTNAGQSVWVPAGNIAKNAGLRMRPQTWQLDDESGNVAALSTKWANGDDNSQQACYLRSDLLEEFCAKNGYSILRIVRGQRRIYWKRLETLEEKGKLERIYVGFAAIYHNTERIETHRFDTDPLPADEPQSPSH
jgi:hypothetical protein